MPVPIYPQSVATTSVSLGWEENGELTSLVAQVEINYGTFGRSAQVPLLEKLSPTERDLLQQLATKLRAIIQIEILG